MAALMLIARPRISPHSTFIPITVVSIRPSCFPHWLVGATVLMLATFVLDGAASALETFSTAQLTISSSGQKHEFKVELAVTLAQRAQGLMWRRRLKAGHGMLFLFQKDRIIQMWMKNTLIPLDILFIDGQGLVICIKERAVPGSLRAISSEQRARAVLELRGGVASQLGLRPGDKVSYKAFGIR